MPSKIVVDKQKSAGKVKEFGLVNARLIAKNIVAKLANQLPPDADPAVIEASLVMVMEASAGSLEDSATRMADADETHNAEIADDVEPRNRRDKHLQDLRDHLIDLRDSFRGAYGPQYVRGLGFSSETPQDPVMLVRFAKEVVRVVRERKQKGTLPPLKKGFSFDPEGPLAEIETTANELEAAIGDINREQREFQDTLARKNEAISEYDKHFSRTIRLYTGLAVYAGMEEQAGKIRPSERHPGTLEEEEEQTANQPEAPTPAPNSPTNNG